MSRTGRVVAGEFSGDGTFAHLSSGSNVAGYRLEAQVGAGGMAVVYRARDDRLGRTVALKVMTPGLAAEPGFRQRFIRESRTAAAVDHPHILPVYEAGEADGVLFIAMRFVSGGDLRSLAAREGPLPAGRAMAFIAAAASALDAAHAAGLVHRDVKPANMLVDSRPGEPDHLYLSDFGLSKSVLSAASASLTGSAEVFGTPDYLAPEQASGAAVDGRADQYALGCAAFTLLTGTKVFERDHPMAVLLAHISQPPPSLTGMRPDLPPAADKVLARALAKTPEDRYASCSDFAVALTETLGLPSQRAAALAGQDAIPVGANDHAHTVTAATISPRQMEAAAGRPGFAGPGPEGTAAVTAAAMARPAQLPGGKRRLLGPGWRRAAIVALAVAVAAAGTAVGLLTKPGTHNPTAAAQRASPPATNHSTPLNSPSPTSAPSSTPPTGHGYRISRVATLNDQSPAAFSADGKTLATVNNSGSSILLWDIATRTLIATLTNPVPQGNGSFVALSPDGQTVAAVDETDGTTYLLDVSSGRTTLTIPDPGSGGATGVVFSPDGGMVAVGDSNGIKVWYTGAGEIGATLTGIGSGVPISFSADSSTLAIAGGITRSGAADPNVYLLNVQTDALTATLAGPDGAQASDVAFSPDGRTLAIAGDANDPVVHIWELATDSVGATLTDPRGTYPREVAFSPDGKTLTVDDDNGQNYIWNVATNTLIAALPSTGVQGNHSGGATLSPDGTTVATAEYLNGTNNISTVLWSIAS